MTHDVHWGSAGRLQATASNATKKARLWWRIRFMAAIGLAPVLAVKARWAQIQMSALR